MLDVSVVTRRWHALGAAVGRQAIEARIALACGWLTNSNPEPTDTSDVHSAGRRSSIGR